MPDFKRSRDLKVLSGTISSVDMAEMFLREALDSSVGVLPESSVRVLSEAHKHVQGILELSWEYFREQAK